MKFLHTSDWHIGRKLFNKHRYDCHKAFLDWLLDTIKSEGIDALLVAGDIFDTTLPSYPSHKLYYDFLSEVEKTCCRHVVIIGGNHDSPSFLNAPKGLLLARNVHVIGEVTENPEDEVIVLYDGDTPEAIICAVPYLRDRDMRTSEYDENAEEKEQKLLKGIEDHYKLVATIAEEKRRDLGADLPIIGMGHLFTSGGRTTDRMSADGLTIERRELRDLYVGSLGQVSGRIFPESMDYVALGHLHTPQLVMESEHLRFCGSPIAMSFGESKQTKAVCVVEFEHRVRHIKTIEVPKFQKLARIHGNIENLSARLKELAATAESYWVEATYDGAQLIGNLKKELDGYIEGSAVEILLYLHAHKAEGISNRIKAGECLENLEPDEVFEARLNKSSIPEEQRVEVWRTYREAFEIYSQNKREGQ